MPSAGRLMWTATVRMCWSTSTEVPPAKTAVVITNAFRHLHNNGAHSENCRLPKSHNLHCRLNGQLWPCHYCVSVAWTGRKSNKDHGSHMDLRRGNAHLFSCIHLCFYCVWWGQAGQRGTRSCEAAVRPLPQRGNDNNNESNKWLKVQHSCGEILHFDGERLDWAHGLLFQRCYGCRNNK